MGNIEKVYSILQVQHSEEGNIQYPVSNCVSGIEPNEDKCTFEIPGVSPNSSQ